jgi:hypothetical protein
VANLNDVFATKENRDHKGIVFGFLACRANLSRHSQPATTEASATAGDPSWPTHSEHVLLDLKPVAAEVDPQAALPRHGLCVLCDLLWPRIGSASPLPDASKWW